MKILFFSKALSNIYDTHHINKVRKNLEEISDVEKQHLTSALKQAVLSQFGYTLFGEKPISFATYWDEEAIEIANQRRRKPPSEKIKKLIAKENLKRKKGWKVWDQYAHLFPSKNFIISKHFNRLIKGGVEIYLVNKKAFAKTVEENRQDFETVLGKNFSLEEIFHSIEKGEGIFFEKIVKHDGLFGTLLGFGRNNAWDFRKKTYLRAKYSRTPEEEKEISEILNKFQGFNNEWFRSFRFVYLPFFFADLHSDETKDLKKRYEKTRQKIQSLYRRRNFLEVTLLQFTKD